MTRNPWRRWAVFVALLAGLVAVAFVPTETKQGIDFVVTTHRLPLYAKTLDFLQRDSSYARLASTIVSGDMSPESRAMALFEWTRKNVRNTPAGFPVVDDHVSHIIIRGYGEDDQKADVFTTLATYAGVPAYWTWIGDGAPHLVLSLAWIDGHWRVFDVANGIAFRNRRGGLASAEELSTDPALVESLPAREYESKPYTSFFEGFHLPPAPGLLRAEMQMMWPRAFHRVKRLVGLGRREWEGDRQ